MCFLIMINLYYKYLKSEENIMKKTLTKIMSVIMAMMIAASCASVAFAEEEVSYPYNCPDCGDLIENMADASVHSMLCESYVCDVCGETFSYIVGVVHKMTCGYELRIKNNPGETTLNYGDTLRLSADVFYVGEKLDDRELGVEYVWTADSGAVNLTTYGDYCDVEAVKAGTVTITVTLVNEEGAVLGEIDENGEKAGFIDSQTITVKAGFFQKLISFFKDLFGMDRTIVQ